MKTSCSLLTLWTKGQLVKAQTVFSGQHKCASRFVWGDRETITGGDGGETHLVEKICLWRWTCLPRPCVRSRLRDRSQEAGPTSHIQTENSASPFSVLVQHQRRPPISQIADFAIWVPWGARTWFWVGKERWTGHRGTVLSYQRYRPSVCTNTRLMTAGRAHRNCCWMWAPSWYWSQRNLREFQCGWLRQQKKKTAHSLERRTAMACHRALKSLLINLIRPLLAKRNFHGSLFTAFSLYLPFFFLGFSVLFSFHADSWHFSSHPLISILLFFFPNCSPLLSYDKSNVLLYD